MTWWQEADSCVDVDYTAVTTTADKNLSRIEVSGRAFPSKGDVFAIVNGADGRFSIRYVCVPC